jgi:hypothetical protein
MEKYENKSIQLRRHLKNAVEYMEKDTTHFPLHETTAFLKGYIEGLQKLDDKNYDAWLKEQQEAVS